MSHSPVDRALLVELMDFLSVTLGPQRRWHPGLLAFTTAGWQLPGSPGGAVHVEREPDGTIAGMALLEGPLVLDDRPLGASQDDPDADSWLEVVTRVGHPRRNAVAARLVEWGLATSRASHQGAVVGPGENEAARALAAAGFADVASDPGLAHLPRFVTMALDLTAHPDVAPEDATGDATGAGRPRVWLRPVGADEAPERSECHAAAWSVLPPGDPEHGGWDPGQDAGQPPHEHAAGDPADGAGAPHYEHARVMAAPGYRRELDWVALDEAGRMLASALVWLDDASGVALLEPVGVVPQARGRGLGRAVSLAALMAARRAGARTALVQVRGDAAYPLPRRLYRSMGFRTTGRSLTLVRST